MVSFNVKFLKVKDDGFLSPGFFPFKALVETFPMMKFLHSPMPLVILALTVPVELHAGMVDH